jgi:DNA-binding NarL/FixJ family response regulator
LKFLLADDSSIPRDYARRIVTRMKHEVVFLASNGKEAVDWARAYPFGIDVAILDISMPVMTGTEAARIFIAEKLATYTLIASSNSQRALVMEMEKIGAGFIAKPYEPEQMQSHIRRYVPNA